jgi:diguanylate cyclase (GGDEF)-like protein/PAS domain S-box-containing protein
MRDAEREDRRLSGSGPFSSPEWFDKLFAASPVAMSITRLRDKTIVGVNDAWLEMLGYRRDEVVGRSRGELNVWVDPQERDALVRRIAETGSVRNIEIRYRRKTGEHLVVFGAAEVLEIAGEKYTLGTAFDISDRKRRELRVQYLATHDALTDLPNRTLLQDRLQQALRNAERHSSRVAVLFVDLDGFKVVNDTLGHRVGDDLLREVAFRLSSCVREADTVARFGGDEFVVVVEAWHSVAEVTAVADKMCRTLAYPFTGGVRLLQPRASIGVSIYPTHGADADALLRNADAAMYAAKGEGGGCCVLFEAPAESNVDT